MKNLRYLALGLIIFCFASCREQVEELSGTKEIITRGNWSINYYFTGTDRTAQYQDYSFTFQNNGTMMAVKASDTVRGTWNVITDANYKDIVRISFEPTAHTSELNANWNVTDLTMNSVAMKEQASAQLRFRKL